MYDATAPRRILFAGGDLRQVTAAGVLAKTFAVSMAGFDRLDSLPEQVEAVPVLSDLQQAFDALILPMPVSQDGISVYAPFGGTPLHLTELLPHVRAGGDVCGGMLTEADRKSITHAGLHAADYVRQETFALRNAVPTAEGAILTAMQELPVTLHGLPCLIIGAGRVSRALQQRLRGLYANVTVAARRFTDLARSKGCMRKPPYASPSV